MNDPVVSRVVGAAVFAALLAAVVMQGDRAAHPDRSAEVAVAMIRDGLDRAATHP